MKTEKWFPKPAELINLAREIADDQTRASMRSLPAPTYRDYTDDEYRSLLNIARMCGEMGIEPNERSKAAYAKAHAWQAAQERGVA